VKWLLALVPVLAGCPKSGTPSGKTEDARITALTLLMKNDINPAFSKLTFLVFHGDSMQEEPAMIKLEATNAAGVLNIAMEKLRVWQEPPTQTAQGKEVFYTYSNAVGEMTTKLSQAIARDDMATAAAQMQQIAKTCNSCHHFFRLKIEDSVVPGSTP
jgi:hypothetical protein